VWFSLLCPFNGGLVFTAENNSTAADASTGLYSSSHSSAFPQRSQREQLSPAASLAGPHPYGNEVYKHCADRSTGNASISLVGKIPNHGLTRSHSELEGVYLDLRDLENRRSSDYLDSDDLLFLSGVLGIRRDRTLVRSLRESGRTVRPAAYRNQKDGKALLRILKRDNRRSGKIRAPRLGIGFGSEKH
jgi:hypothetical protein